MDARKYLMTKLTEIPVTLALDAVATTTIFTVPIGKIMIPFGLPLVAGADCGASVLTVGRVGALTDFIASITLSNIDAAGDMAWLQPVPNATPVLLKTYAAGVIFQIDVTTALGGAVNYVDLFGWLKDA
ncbi:MAG: hypothetical protein JRE58_02390 [Deltaproteobacteria bacterium]|nr:hypothetical protein [Deltaproteobacteria bacterium]